MSLWDAARWDVDVWDAAHSPPGMGGWGGQWSWWYQDRHQNVVVDLDDMLVEARWSTDSYTMGDGTFRGDLQPGQITAQFNDPDHLLEGLDKLGGLWAYYAPLGVAWCWYYDSITRGLYSSGDSAGADVVYTGTPWPLRLTSGLFNFNRPVESVTARLQSIADVMNGNTGYTFYVPHVATQLAAQSQQVTPNVSSADPNNYNLYPGFLPTLRTAAAPGIAWWGGQGKTGGPGTHLLSYARWDTYAERDLVTSQIIAGPPISQSADWVVTRANWHGTKSDGTTSASGQTGSWWQQYGFAGPDMRMVGDVTVNTGPEYNACYMTGTQLCKDRNPDASYLSTLSVCSGDRYDPDTGELAARWNPAAHVWAPTEVLRYTDPATQAQSLHRVAQSAHRLTATTWQTTHTLDFFTAPLPLP